MRRSDMTDQARVDSGIVDIIEDEEYQMKMSARLKDGKLSVVTLAQSKNIVNQET